MHYKCVIQESLDPVAFFRCNYELHGSGKKRKYGKAENLGQNVGIW